MAEATSSVSVFTLPAEDDNDAATADVAMEATDDTTAASAAAAESAAASTPQAATPPTPPTAAAATDDAGSTGSAVSDGSSTGGGGGAGGGAGAGPDATAAPTASAGTAVDLDDPKAVSTAFKDQGNDAFKAGHFPQAIDLYTKGIEAKPTAVLYSNRAAAYLKTESFGLAISDAEKAKELDATYVKAYYRHASALLALGRYKKALVDFKRVVKLKPKDKAARKKYMECNKAVKRQAFEAAIRTDDAPSAVEAVDVGQIAVSGSYKGPRLGDDSKVTLEFVTELMKFFQGQGRLHKKYAVAIIKQTHQLLQSLPSLVEVDVPEKKADGTEGHFNVCGDTHGQYYDLLNIFEVGGLPGPENPYLFNGDFVDRGSFSVENVLVLFAFKLLYPNHFHLTRGNHESVNMNKVYGFEGEVKAKFDDTVMPLFRETFQALPLAVCISKRVLVVHGGLGGNRKTTLADIKAINRFREPPESGLMSELLWSDPQPFQGVGPSKRGIGVSFGPDVTRDFLKHNGLELLIRSHEVKEEGFLIEHDGNCITVFSAPNYCDQMGNKGCIIRLDTKCKPTFLQYTAVPHPPIRPMAFANTSPFFGL